MLLVTYTAPEYKPELVTGRYVRRVKSEGRGNYRYKVFETATCWRKGMFYGKPGMGYTLREYITDSAGIPESVAREANETMTTVKWD